MKFGQLALILVFLPFFVFPEIPTPEMHQTPMPQNPQIPFNPQNPTAPPIGPGTEIPGLKHTESELNCKKVGGRYKPAHRKYNRGLGSSAMSKARCERAIAESKNDIVCSYTGIGFKPTYIAGTTPARRDYGYAGTSMKSFEDCLLATKSSIKRGVCNCNETRYGPRCTQWKISDIQGRANFNSGMYRNVNACIAALKKRYRD